MPVSPADFEFYSRMTGQPIPNTPAGRMAIAPQVYAMRRSPMSKVAGFLGELGKTAALAGGAVAGGLLLNDLYQQRRTPNQTSEVKQANTVVKSQPANTQAAELADSQQLEPAGVDTTPAVPDQALIDQQGGGEISSMTPLSGLSLQEGEERVRMQKIEEYEGSKPGGPSPYQEAFQELGRQAQDVRRLKKENPGASLEFLKGKINEYQSPEATGQGDENVSPAGVGAQTVLFPQSEVVKGITVFPSATGEGGVGRADIVYRDISKEQKELPIQDQGRYPYMLTKEGQQRMKGITEGIAAAHKDDQGQGDEEREQVGRSANELLTDFTRRKQLISLDPKSESRYGIKPSLSTIL